MAVQAVQVVQQAPKKKPKIEKRDVHINMGVFYLQKSHYKNLLKKESLTVASIVSRFYGKISKNERRWIYADFERSVTKYSCH